MISKKCNPFRGTQHLIIFSFWCSLLLFLPLTPLCISQSYGYDGEGIAIISPLESIVGKYRDYQIIFGVGLSGIKKGGFIRIDLPGNTTFHGLPPKLNWSRPQISKPFAEGFVSVTPAHKFNLKIEPYMHPLSHNYSYKIKLISTTQLYPYEKIIISYSRARSQRIMQSCFFHVLTDTNGDGKGKPIFGSPKVQVKGGEAKHVRVVIPSIIGISDRFDVKVVILDQFGFPCSGYTGTITFSSNGTIQNLPASYTFSKNDNSIHIFKDVSFLNKGKFLIRVTDGATNDISNPCVVTPRIPPYRIYWGDIHWHSNFSDGLRSPSEGYLYAKYVTFLDFTAMTDHDSLLDFKNLWPTNNLVSQHHYSPGDFITFNAYEWTSPSALEGGSGHRNVYFLDDSQPLFSNSSPETATTDLLWSQLEGRDAITIPHHVAEASISVIDWSSYNDVLQPLGEIYSGHGSSEYQGGEPPYFFNDGVPGYFIQDALAMGHKLGFIASTDSHLTLPGGNDILSGYLGYRHALPALTAVYSPALTRPTLLNQLKNRHTYATTGKRVILKFTINGTAFMGDELSSGENPHISVTVIGGTSIVKKVEIIRDNETIHQIEPNSSSVNMTFDDSQFLNFLSGSTHYYYVRVTLADTFLASMVDGMRAFPHLAWSSPIWVTKE